MGRCTFLKFRTFVSSNTFLSELFLMGEAPLYQRPKTAIEFETPSLVQGLLEVKVRLLKTFGVRGLKL